MARGGGEVGNWWEKCTGGALAGATNCVFWPAPKMCEGALDCIVVNVVVRSALSHWATRRCCRQSDWCSLCLPLIVLNALSLASSLQSAHLISCS